MWLDNTVTDGSWPYTPASLFCIPPSSPPESKRRYVERKIRTIVCNYTGAIVVEEAEDAEGTKTYRLRKQKVIFDLCCSSQLTTKTSTLISANNTLARSITSQGGTHTLRRHFHRAKRIILIRHGESEGNVDESAYVNTADWQICLTDKGKRQAQNAGAKLKKLLSEDDSIFFYVSPYKRTLQTLAEIQDYFPKEQIWGIREEPRIAEQQFGNFQNVEQVRKAKIERKKNGK